MASIDCSTVFWVYGKASTTVTVLNTDISDTCLRFIDGYSNKLIIHCYAKCKEVSDKTLFISGTLRTLLVWIHS